MTKVMSGIAIGLGIVSIGLDIFSIIKAAKRKNKVEIAIRIVIEELKKKHEIKCD
jgi:molybdopterin synthase catalytic subunit